MVSIVKKNLGRTQRGSCKKSRKIGPTGARPKERMNWGKKPRENGGVPKKGKN